MGCSKEVTLVRDEACEHCHGTGARPGTQPQTCPTCKGAGQVRVTQNTAFGRIQNVRVCDTCHGEGKVVQEYSLAGSGYTPEKATEVTASDTFDFSYSDGLLAVTTDQGTAEVALRYMQGGA